MNNLKKHSTRKVCRNCGITNKGTSPDCEHCTKNPTASLNWRPDLETCKNIVLYYINQRSHISATELSINSEIPVEIIEGAIAQLVKEKVLKTETSVVIVE